MVGLHCTKKDEISIVSCFTLIHTLIRSHLYWIKLVGQMGNFTATVCLRLQTLPMSAQNSWFYHVYGRGGGGGKQKGADNKQRTCTPKVMKSIPKLSVSLYGPLTVLQNVSERFTFTG